MPADDAPQSARIQLQAVAAASAAGTGNPGWAARVDLPDAPDARSAAVLVLFGVLDSAVSERDARTPAVPRDLDVLLLSRATTLRSHPGQVAFPGGRIDPSDESVVAAALREAQEETGLDPAGV